MKSFDKSYPQKGYLSKKQVRQYLGGISSTTLHDWIKYRGFPKPIYMTTKTPLWRCCDVEFYVESQVNDGQAEQKGENDEF